MADVSFNLIFGINARTFEENSECLERALTSLYSTSYESIRTAIYVIFPWTRKIIPEQFTSPEFTVWFKDLFNQAVKLRKKSNVSRDDYLSYLIDVQEKKNVSMDLIHSYAYSYFLDGFETSAYALGNVINNLAANPRCQEKLREEINSYDQITYESLHQMPYLEAVLNGN